MEIRYLYRLDIVILNIVLVVCNFFGLVCAMEQHAPLNTQAPDCMQRLTSTQTIKVLTVEQLKTATYRIVLGYPLERAEYFLRHFCRDKAFLLQDVFEVIQKIKNVQEQEKPRYVHDFPWTRTVLDWAIVLGTKGLPMVQQLINGAGLRYMLILYLDARGDGLLHLTTYTHNKELIDWLIQEGREKVFCMPFCVNKKNAIGFTPLDIAQHICQDPTDSFFNKNQEIIEILMMAAR